MCMRWRSGSMLGLGLCVRWRRTVVFLRRFWWATESSVGAVLRLTTGSSEVSVVETVTTDEMISEAQRDLERKRSVYPRMVREGKMNAHMGWRRIEIAEAILATLWEIKAGKLAAAEREKKPR